MSPRIHILARPLFTDSIESVLLDLLPVEEARWVERYTATPVERLVEFAGRICYMSFGSKQSSRTNAEYISNLIRNGHESVLEHAVWTFALLGVSRAFTHQLVRHRVGFSFSQLSQQYHDETDAEFVRPQGIESVPRAAAAWDRAILEARNAYRELLKALEAGTDKESRKRAEEVRAIRSAARSVLPNATKTAVVITANARALRHFLKLRGGILGDLEMRAVSAELLRSLQTEAPALFADYSIEIQSDGLPLVTHRRLPPAD